MNSEDQLSHSFVTCSPGKSRWSAGPLIAAGFVAGCVASRSRIGKASLLVLAGGLVWELLRPRPAPMMKPEVVEPIQPVPTPSPEIRAEEPDFNEMLKPLYERLDTLERAIQELAMEPTPMKQVIEPAPVSPIMPLKFDLRPMVTNEAPVIVAKQAEITISPITPPVETPIPQPTEMAPVKEIIEPATSDAEPEPLDLPMFLDAEAITMPFHLDQASSAAWLLGLEPIPLVQEEPEWRKPLLAGIQSAFEASHASKILSIAEPASIPDAVEIIQTTAEISDLEAVIAAQETQPRQQTRGLLGKLFDPKIAPFPNKPRSQPLVAASIKTIEPEFVATPALVNEPEPVAMMEPEPELVPSHVSPSWQGSELHDNKRRAPVIRPLPNANSSANANANAVALAAGSPSRSVRLTTVDGAKKKSWLGLWK
jgi:hypothetical protein